MVYNPRNLPVKPYVPFIKAYEDAVTAAQEKLKKIESLEQPYNIVTEALDRTWRGNNELTLTAHTDAVVLDIKALESDRYETFLALAKVIGTLLHEAGVHRSGTGSHSRGGYWHQLVWSWNGEAKNGAECSVMMQVELPVNGIVDLAVEVVTRTTQSSQFIIKDRPA